MLEKKQETSFEELNLRYRRALEAYFRRRVGNQWEAEDLAQEVFLRLVPKMRSADVEDRNAYIFKVATNLLRDRARRRRARCDGAHFSLDAMAEGDGASASGTGETFLVDERGPERILLGREQLEDVFGALDELGERTRNIFLMFRMEGMKQKDIAAALGISVSAIEKHLVKALCHLSDRV